MKKTQLLLVLTSLLHSSQSSTLAAQQKELHLRWEELAQVISDQKVAIVMPGGAHIEGQVKAVEPDSLVVNITRTSDRQAYPKGPFSITRSSVSVLQLKKMQHRWRVTGTLIGAGAGLLAGWGVALLISADEKPRPAATGAFVGITAGLATAGYFLGREADRQVTMITVVP